jgi:hypothetical protein
MIASKVSFSQHTKEMLNARPLSRTHKSKLRQQRIIEYIRELKYGECQKSDLIMAGGWDISNHQSYANGWAFIERLKKNKVIQMVDGSNPKNSYIKKWVVLADVHTVKVENGKMTVPATDGVTTVKPDVIKVKPSEAQTSQSFTLTGSSGPVAQTNSDSLREFIAWYKR